MKTEVLLKLIEAGYNKDEIALMEEVEAKPVQTEVPEMPSEAEQAAEEKPAETEADPSDRMTETINDIMHIIAKMQKTLDGMQQKNAKNAESEQPARLTAETEADPSDRMTETINDIMHIIAKMQKTLDGMQQKNAKNAESEQPARLTADDVVKNFFGNTKKA